MVVKETVSEQAQLYMYRARSERVAMEIVEMCVAEACAEEVRVEVIVVVFVCALYSTALQITAVWCQRIVLFALQAGSAAPHPSITFVL